MPLAIVQGDGFRVPPFPLGRVDEWCDAGPGRRRNEQDSKAARPGPGEHRRIALSGDGRHAGQGAGSHLSTVPLTASSVVCTVAVTRCEVVSAGPTVTVRTPTSAYDSDSALTWQVTVASSAFVTSNVTSFAWGPLTWKPTSF